MFVHNYVIAGGRHANPGSLSMRMEPVKLSDGMGIAIKSIAYGEICNISEVNNSFTIGVSVEVRVSGETTKSVEHVKLSIQNGRYNLREHVMLSIRDSVNKYIASIGLSVPVEIERSASQITLKFPDFIQLFPCTKESPITIIEAYRSHENMLVAKTGNIPEWTEMCFVYLNIVRSSFINGKKSRLLSVFPIYARSGYSYYEFTNPTYVPIEVQEFSEITVTLRNIKGNIIRISDRFDTVVSMHVKSLQS